MQKALFKEKDVDKECIILDYYPEGCSHVRFASDDGTFDDEENNYFIETSSLNIIKTGENNEQVSNK
jgi:hypothetical protein